MNRILANIMKKIFACFLAVVVAFPLIAVPTTAYGASLWDIKGHWAEASIKKAVSIGFAKGYPDGDFQPDKAVTRAEFTTMVNKALGNTGSASVSFSDVPYNEWYYNDIAKGVSAAFVGGYDDNTFRPNNPISRQEAAVMISRFVPTYGQSGNLSSFKDKNSVSDWASDAVAKVSAKGYMGAYPDGKIHPLDNLTRGQTAKILCDILDKETIVSSSTTVKSKGTTLSGRIYSNNVTMHSDLGDGNAELSNCVVLGTLYVNGGGDDTITVNNSRVANAQVERSSSSVRLLAKGQSVINKTTVGNTATLESSGLSGGSSGTGYNEVNVKSSANTTLKGNFVKVNITGSSADVEVESGAITTLNVTSGGRNATIQLNSKASIGTATVDAAAAFKGSGTINTMNVNSSNVTYETKPRVVKLGSGISNPSYDDDDDDDDDNDIAVRPKDRATGVDVDTDITLTFDTAVKKYNGSTIRDSDIPDLLTVRRSSSSGTKVKFTGEISTSKKVITLTLDEDLDDDTKYYVVIPKNEFKDTNDKGNLAQTTYFTTGDESGSDSIKFYPKSGATGVSRSAKPTITFPEAIQTYAGKDINTSYLDSTVIIFREVNSSGSKVPFKASYSSFKREITISPTSTLTEGKKYYLSFGSRKFRTKSDKETVATESVTWTAGNSSSTVSFNPSNGASNVALNTNIVLSFSTAIYNTSNASPSETYIKNYITLYNNTKGQYVAYNILSFSNNTGGATLTIKPSVELTADSEYTIAVSSSQFRNSSGSYISSASAKFKALKPVVDTSVIDTAISGAQTAKAGIQTSANGSDVYTDAYWVTDVQLTALNNAITTATNAKATVSNATEAQAAATTLNTAVTTFTAARQRGTKARVDTSEITKALAAARDLKSKTSISSNGFDIEKTVYWVTQDVMNTFDSAITRAENSINTVKDVNEAFSEASILKAATRDFNGSRDKGLKPSKTALIAEVDKANDNILKTPVSSDGMDIQPTEKWVSQRDYDSYNLAIRAAEGIMSDSNSTQNVVDAAVSTLKDATSVFDNAKQSGNMVPTPSAGS